MTEFLLLQAIVQAQAQEIAELRTLVLYLQEGLNKWAIAQRSAYAQHLGSSEDYLDTPWNQSLLSKRSKEVRRIP